MIDVGGLSTWTRLTYWSCKCWEIVSFNSVALLLSFLLLLNQIWGLINDIISDLTWLENMFDCCSKLLRYEASLYNVKVGSMEITFYKLPSSHRWLKKSFAEILVWSILGTQDMLLFSILIIKLLDWIHIFKYNINKYNIIWSNGLVIWTRTYNRVYFIWPFP